MGLPLARRHVQAQLSSLRIIYRFSNEFLSYGLQTSMKMPGERRMVDLV